MTEKDKQLIEKAELIPCTEWYEVGNLIPQAESEEAKEWLNSIENRKYHQEERLFERGCGD